MLWGGRKALIPVSFRCHSIVVLSSELVRREGGATPLSPSIFWFHSVSTADDCVTVAITLPLPSSSSKMRMSVRRVSDFHLLRDCFALLDKDSSGTLEYSELHGLLVETAESLHVNIPLQDFLDEFLSMNPSRDGHVQIDDWMSYMESAMDEFDEEKAIRMAWQSFDRNGSGFVDREEFVAVLRTESELSASSNSDDMFDLSIDDIRALFDECVNETGTKKLDFRAFRELLLSPEASVYRGLLKTSSFLNSYPSDSPRLRISASCFNVQPSDDASS